MAFPSLQCHDPYLGNVKRTKYHNKLNGGKQVGNLRYKSVKTTRAVFEKALFKSVSGFCYCVCCFEENRISLAYVPRIK